MISLLFLLLTIAILLVWRNYRRISYVIFAVTLLLSIYWLNFHATSSLTIDL